MEILDSLEKLDGIISSSSPSDNNNINPVIPQNVIESESTATNLNLQNQKKKKLIHLIYQENLISSLNNHFPHHWNWRN